jgi:tetraacyldisaccharide 4'-kinase
VNLILLDDGFQHLPLRGKVNLILSNYHRPFYEDFLMPSGRLREFKSTAKGADIIVVTKCPSELKKDEALKIEGK